MNLESMRGAVETLESNLTFFRFWKNDAKTQTVGETAQTLKRLRGALKRLQICRLEIRKFCGEFDTNVRRLSADIAGNSPNFYRSHGSDSYVTQSRASMSTVNVEDMRAVNALADRFNSVCATIEPIALEVETLTDTLFTLFVDVKKRKALAYGYSEVIGACRAFFATKRGNELSKFNYVLRSNYPLDVYNTLENFPLVLPTFRPTRKPTARSGESALYDCRQRPTRESDCKAARLSRVSRTLARLYPLLGHKEILALIPHYSRIDVVALRWARQRCNCHNVDTYPTSKPLEVSRTARGEVVYRFEAITVAWHTVNLTAEVFFVVYPTDTPETKFDLFHKDTEKLDDILSALERRYQRQLEELERDRVARLSDRQRKAQVLRDCRNVETLTLEDSYRVGNCKPGTFQFCETLGINVGETPTLSGREVAKRWRAAEFVQLPMFERVLSRN